MLRHFFRLLGIFCPVASWQLSIRANANACTARAYADRPAYTAPRANADAYAAQTTNGKADAY